MPSERRGLSLSFFGMVGAVMAALKLKEHVDGYNQVPSDEEGRVALRDAPYRDDGDDGNRGGEERVGLLNTEGETPLKPKRKRQSTCCVCCGVNFGLFCKALGIVTLLFTIYGAVKLIIWAVSPAPTGLENMPVYSESLGCQNAPYLYNGGEFTVKSPLGSHELEHALDIRGSSVGTIVIADTGAQGDEIEYSVKITSNDQSLIDETKHEYEYKNDGSGNGRMRIITPRLDTESSSCIRYDVTIHVPRNLNKLSIAAHTIAHVQFHPDAQIDLKNLYVTLYTMSQKNLILPHQNVRANELKLEVFRGWIVGDAAIMDSTSITTQRADGVSSVRVHPIASSTNALQAAELQTTTGSGRTDIFYVEDVSSVHRPIKSTHMSSQGGDVYLTYRSARFNGRIQLESKSFTATGITSFAGPTPVDGKWTHWVGSEDGADQIVVKSRAWTGLYF